MKISLFQQDIAWLSPSDNYQKIEDTLRSLPDTELLVMPEMCTTGFITIPQPGQIERAADVENRLLSLARNYNTALCGSFAVVDDSLEGPLHNANRCYFITPEGDVSFYDKHHLYTPGMEHKGYKAGETRTTIRWRDITFRLCICFDLRFPTWLHYDNELPYDILICVANWPAARQLAWDTLLRARAIENQAFCIGVNRIGRDTMCDYQGGSCAIHPYGHILASCADNEQSTCTFEPDMQKLRDFRKKFPVVLTE